MSDLEWTNEKNMKQLYISLIKLLHFASSIVIFHAFWLLFRYGGFTGNNDVGYRYNYLVTAGYGLSLQFDLLYINNMSILTDLELMFATVAILFLPESTEGVGKGQTTAMSDDGEV